MLKDLPIKLAMNLQRLSMLFLLLFCWEEVWAADAASNAASFCINGSESKKQFVEQFNQIAKKNPSGGSRSPIEYFLNARAEGRTQGPIKMKSSPTEAGIGNPCRSSPAPDPLASALTALSEATKQVRVPWIKQECVEAALKRENGDSAAKGFYCATDQKNSKRIEVGSPGKNGPCINSDIAAYLTWITNQAIQCLSNNEDPIDPGLVFKKLNNESGFSFFQVRIDGKQYQGTGLAQMTGSGVREVNESGQDRIINTIRTSSKESCAVFKGIIDQPVKGSTDICPLIELNRGVPRSLIYSLGLSLIYRGQLSDWLGTTKKGKNLANDILVDRAARVAPIAYGPDGPGGARQILGKLLKGNILSDTRAVQMMVDKNPYLRSLKRSYNELPGMETSDGKDLPIKSCLDY